MTERDEAGKFIKGASGNPHGRPKKEREERFYEILVTTVTFDRWKRIVAKAADQAERGDQAARKWLADYLVGAPIQRQEITGANGGEVVLRVVYEDKPISEDGV